MTGQEDQAKEWTRNGLDFYLGSLEQAVGRVELKGRDISGKVEAQG